MVVKYIGLVEGIVGNVMSFGEVMSVALWIRTTWLLIKSIHVYLFIYCCTYFCLFVCTSVIYFTPHHCFCFPVVFCLLLSLLAIGVLSLSAISL